MSDNNCPKCEISLEWVGHYSCPSCEVGFDKQAFCPDCDAELEKLQACGSASYFCNTCNELKSKSRAKFVFKEKQAD
ncbi:zinc ribbon domain-containing protein [Vibrio sp. ZSDE26]|uniref:Zinc ribbon domain-containing protein n=1 Tax=Vibrio amylolyticus TaxID=2847292 RepID=A0A9X2BL83_9VIBR|nr:zinc ribbon domain-containing protein [Vibrio amylolyticus]MCK6265387.1 zinc ribbon domain-containing protein [Vibrio amylolyticus]